MEHTPTPRPIRCEIDVTENGFFLTVEADAPAELDNILTADGWRFLNNGVTMDTAPDTIGTYYFKPRK